MKVRNVLVGLLLLGCNNVSAVPVGPQDASPEVSFRDIVSFEPNILEPEPFTGETLPVPGGTTWAGNWPREGDRFRPDCARGTFRIAVGSFRLAKYEVSGADWQRCRTAGLCGVPDGSLEGDPSGVRWDDELHLEQPVAVSHRQARAYCRAYGGDLPTMGQWLRAAQGDDGLGVDKFTWAHLRCAAGEGGSLCEQLRGWDFSRSRPAMPAVHDDAWDVGPYGHVGLYAGAMEWSRYVTATINACEVRDDQAYGEVPAPGELVAAFHPAYAVERTIIENTEVATIASMRRSHDAPYYAGFRCAFPVE